MSGRSRRRARAAERARVTRVVLISLGAVALVVVVCAAWVGVRAAISYGQVSAARAEAKATVAAVAADPVSAASRADRLRVVGDRLDDARNLTGDVVWRACEYIPFAGANLRSYRLTVEALHETVGGGLAPVVADLAKLETAVSLADRTVDTAAVASTATHLRTVERALELGRTTLREASTGPLVPPLASGVTEAQSLVDSLHRTVSSLSVAARVLPAAIGASGAKNYALLFNNNAELRTTGGIAGAISELTADGGRIELGQQLIPDQVNPAEGAGLPVSPEERALYGPQLGEYIQNVNLTPDFVRSGELTAAHWRAALGQELDGVVSIDTATIGLLLSATGPITVAGRELNSENASRVLLRDVYLEIESRDEQDVFFGELTRAMFDKLFGSGTGTVPVLKALGTAVDQGRISLWFADAALQREIAGGPLAGPLAQLTDRGAPVGVFLADGTAGKMDSYLEGSVTATCHAPAKRDAKKPAKVGSTVTATATLASTAPADIASFPWVVTGYGVPDLPAGHIRTLVQFAATDSLRPQRVKVDGAEVTALSRMIDGHPVSVVQVDLAPGAVSVVVAEFAALPTRSPTVDRVVATPTATEFEHFAEPGTCG
ncbi:DUF4012 domain-containing protein [Leifsonia sp. NPDC056665]|uniref:DUF4012 domain-containing protein n=1 Tax=Leifsonia sp. NPDC056665 TaxID=3345901 RepID=UPI0036900864